VSNLIKSLILKYKAKREEKIVNAFHNLYYNNSKQTWFDTRWFGVNALKCPLDLWIYQEMIYEIKPDLIIETGTANGGSALYMASIMDLLNHGEIITIDVNRGENMPEHKRINYLHGFSTSQEIIDQVKTYVENKQKILVILDSDHSKENVLGELRLYNKFVSKDSYVIVEDSNVNGHPTCPEFGPGPWEAIDAFLNENNEFEIDKKKEKFYLTLNPNGYLRKNK